VATPKETLWEIEPHTVAKHAILRRYLGAWFAILGTTNRRIAYIDGFCGPGQYTGGEPGSPIVALEEALKHADRLSKTQITFLLADERSDRTAHLRDIVDQFPVPPNITIAIETGQFEHKLAQLLDGLDADGQCLAPTFAFVDPFGFKGLPFHLVRRLLCNPKTEVFVNVMADAINRFLDHPDDQITSHIVDLFGTDEVLEIARDPRVDDRIEALRRLYQLQLERHARFVRYFEMRDHNDRVIYYLFFAGNHRQGHKKMKEAFWKVDTSSGLRFSDATNPCQPVLFEVDGTPGLAEHLSSVFSRKQLYARGVLEHVEDATAFTASHARKALKLLEGDGRIMVADTKSDGKKRRRNTYPPNSLIRFG